MFSRGARVLSHEMEERRHPGQDMEGYLRELAEVVGFDAAASAAVRASAPAVLKHEAALTAAVYEHFLKFPASARFFLAPDGTPDAARIERRRHSLGRWLRETAEAALTHDSADATSDGMRNGGSHRSPSDPSVTQSFGPSPCARVGAATKINAVTNQRRVWPRVAMHQPSANNQNTKCGSRLYK